jgi:hypothetical protein
MSPEVATEVCRLSAVPPVEQIEAMECQSMADTESVDMPIDVLADAKRLARKLFLDDRATIDRLDAPEIKLFLKKLNDVFDAAAANALPSTSPADFLRCVQRIARENGMAPRSINSSLKSSTGLVAAAFAPYRARQEQQAERKQHAGCRFRNWLYRQILRAGEAAGNLAPIRARIAVAQVVLVERRGISAE